MDLFKRCIILLRTGIMPNTSRLATKRQNSSAILSCIGYLVADFVSMASLPQMSLERAALYLWSVLMAALKLSHNRLF